MCETKHAPLPGYERLDEGRVDWDGFTEELSRLLNHHCLDAFCAAPDYILASSVVDHLRNMARTQYAIHVFEESPE